MIFRAKYWQVSALLIGLLLLLVCNFLIPEIEIFSRKKIELRELTLLNLSIARQENYRKLKEDKAEKANYLKSLENGLYLEAEASARLFRSLKEIAFYSNNQLIRFSLGSVNKKGIYPSIVVQFIIQGSYVSMINFYKLLKEIPPCSQLNFTFSQVGENLHCLFDIEVLLQP